MKFSVKEAGGATVTLTERREGEIIFTDVKVSYPVPTCPSPIKLNAVYGGGNVYSYYASNVGTARVLRPNWSPHRHPARLASGFPLFTAISLEGKNRVTLQLSDAKIPTSISQGVSEDDSRLYFTVTLFENTVNAVTEFQLTIRTDLRDIRYEKAIFDAVGYWEECGYKCAPVPELARHPVNSSWYTYHQDIDVSDIVDECRLSKQLGMDVLILDDGWMTDDVHRGYAFCGDWKVAEKKMGNMRTFVDKVHKEGLKFVLWYSVPFVGCYSKAYERFKDMYLNKKESPNGFWIVLDPRYPEVREYLVDVYVRAVREYGLDGFKLDFIDSFTLALDRAKEPDCRRDTESLEDATELLLCEIYKAVTALKPDALFEFRQSYVGPTVRKYGNMLRVSDCPMSPLTNRVESINLRLSSGESAVHSDMVMWNPKETAEQAASALIATLFSVPQISMRIKELSREHYEMLKFYLAFANEWRDVLLLGTLRADNPESLYSRVSAEKDGRGVTVLYSNSAVKIEKSFKEYLVVNGTDGDTVYLDLSALEGNYSFKVFDCRGRELECRTVAAAILALNVPRSGIIKITKPQNSSLYI